MKSIEEFEKDLQAIDPDFTIRANEHNELAGIYWKEYYTEIAVPKSGIKAERDENYADQFDRPHRSEPQVLERINTFLDNLKNPEYMEELTNLSLE